MSFKVGDTFVDQKRETWRLDSLIPEGKIFAGEWVCTELNSGDEGIWSVQSINQCLDAANTPKIISSALDTQIGGSHYKSMPIQPMEYSMKNGLDACQHTIIKYVTRFREKGGIEDLEKAKHCIDLLIGFEKEKE